MMRIFRSKRQQRRAWESYGALLDEWGVPVETLDIPTRYGTTRVNAAGEGSLPPLVLLHGVGDDSALMWVYNARELSGKMRLYAVDTIGGPGMSVPNGGYDAAFDDKLWLDDVLDGLGLAQTDIAGVSHGGYLAQMYAIERPERVGKIACLAASVPVGKGNPMKTMMKIFMPEAAFPTRTGVVRLLKKLSGENFEAFTGDPNIMEHFTALLRGYNNMAMRWHKVVPYSPEQVQALGPRALYIAGDRDPFMAYGGKDALQKLGMRCVFYPTAGHGINHELPGEVDKKLMEWFC